MASTVAVNSVALTKTVPSAVPFHFTDAPATKPLPFTVNVNAWLPAVMVFGLRELIVGAATIVKSRVLDVTPPDDTLTCAVPTLATKFAGTVAVSSFALWKFVDSAEPFHCTVAPDTNPVPFAVSVNDALPAVIVSGLRPLSAGPATIVRVSELDVVLTDFTVIWAEPGAAIRFEGTEAVNSPELRKLVGSVVVVPEMVHCTTEPETKLLPFTVNRNAAPPAVTVAGLMDVIAGAATVKLAEFDVTPPEVTVTVNTPVLVTKLAGTVTVN